MHAHSPLTILVVDDDPGDTLLICDALTEGPTRHEVATAADGAEGLEHLRAHPGTDLVLLDLNMPKMSGHEVLAAVKADEALRHIPVIVFTTSAAPDDVLASYRLHGSAYITKPADFDRFGEVISQIGHFYDQVARLPRRSESPSASG
jgi:CheY-like chemotaxis protein